MALYTPSIEKLQKKLEKEPNSLIFLQLAEEYRKEGYYEDALRACRDGLKRHPNYWSARVAMGRIFYEMADYEQARDELEKVIKAVPDNLLANKLLGDIYLQTDRPEDALKRYQIVQMLTPNDQDVVANIRKIESTFSQKSGTQSMPAPEINDRSPQASMVSNNNPNTTAEIPFPPIQFSDGNVQMPDQHFAESSFSGNASGVHSGGALPESLEKTSPVIFFDARALTEQEMSEKSQDAAGFLEASQHDGFGSSSVTDFRSNQTMDSTAGSTKTEDQTQPMDEKEEDVAEHQADELTTQTLAELYVQQGLTEKAIKVYQKLLLNDPTNIQTINRLKELNPADSLLSGNNDRIALSAKSRDVEDPGNVYASVSKSDPLSEERRKKISTLENWLTSIRRERP
jgi:tetratricopeptide (TPR) repeat protein